MAVRRFDQVRVGEELPGQTIHVDRAALVRYAGASLDRNPIHWDERFAISVGLPDVIAHGMWTMGAVVGVVSNWVGDGGRILEYGTRFTRPVVVPYDGGADVVVTAKVKSVNDDTRRAVIDITARSGEDKVLGRCQATVQLD